jgi:hypothetical protein
MKPKTQQAMKKLNYKQALLLFLPLLLSASLTAQEVTKNFHKEFPAGDNTILQISNKYGDVVVNSWDKNQVVIDVKVTVELPNREKAEKMIEYINVDFSQSDNTIDAKTVIDDKFNFSGWGGGSKRFRIDYNVNMPVKAALALSNRYGNTEIDELTGQVNLDIKYGNLSAGKLTRGNVKPFNKISLAYGKATIDEAGWLDLYIRYAPEVEITKSQALLLDSRYSKLKLDETSSLVGEGRYDGINIDNINNLVLENGYGDVNIGTLNRKLDYTGSYGSFNIEHVPADFESLNVSTKYMGVKLGIEENASYNLDAKVSYGGLKYNEDNFRNERRVVQNNSHEVAGIVGKGEPKSKVTIDSSYGTLRLEED